MIRDGYYCYCDYCYYMVSKNRLKRENGREPYAVARTAMNGMAYYCVAFIYTYRRRRGLTTQSRDLTHLLLLRLYLRARRARDIILLYRAIL